MVEWLVPVAVLYLLHRAHVINLDYPIRQAIRFRRGGLALAPEPKDGLFPPEETARVAAFVETYHLQDWAREADRWSFQASMFYLEMLERAFREGGVRLPGSVRVLEAGPSDWFYVRTLHGLLKHFNTERPREVRLDGVEVDAFQVYRDLYTTYDWAHAYMGGVEGVRYLAEDVRRYRDPVDLGVMMFPFLFPSDHLKWGLPKRYLKPEQLLAHVWGLVEPGGYLVIANQGAAEREFQHQLLGDRAMPIAWWSRHDSTLYHYEPERYITVVGPKAG